jgi:hypothetical protein
MFQTDVILHLILVYESFITSAKSKIFVCFCNILSFYRKKAQMLETYIIYLHSHIVGMIKGKDLIQ